MLHDDVAPDAESESHLEVMTASEEDIGHCATDDPATAHRSPATDRSGGEPHYEEGVLGVDLELDDGMPVSCSPYISASPSRKRKPSRTPSIYHEPVCKGRGQRKKRNAENQTAVAAEADRGRNAAVDVSTGRRDMSAKAARFEERKAALPERIRLESVDREARLMSVDRVEEIRKRREALPKVPDHWGKFRELSARDVDRTGIVHLKARKPKLTEMPRWCNVGNFFVNHVMVGEACDAMDLAKWCADAKEHVIVCSLTEKAQKENTFLKTFMDAATCLSLRRALGQHADCEELMEKTDHAMNLVRSYVDEDFMTAVAAAIRKKFVYQVFRDTFIIVHLHFISFIKWSEWDAGPYSRSRFGTLQLVFAEGKQRWSDYSLGIVSLASRTDAKHDIWEHLIKWIQFDRLTFVCGNYGHGNEAGIRKTAVAANASVSHRVCTTLDYKQYDDKIPLCYCQGGFLCFATYDKDKFVDAVSELPTATLAELGNDLIDDALALKEVFWPEGDGNPGTPDLWKFRKK